MRPWVYPIIAVVFNYILFHSFHWGEYGGALAIILTIPVIAIVSLVLTFIHYRLDKKGQKKKQFQIAGIVLVILVSYYLFPTQNSPISIINKMRTTAKDYNGITMSDFFLDRRYENYERIVAAKKKFKLQLPDNAEKTPDELLWAYKIYFWLL